MKNKLVTALAAFALAPAAIAGCGGDDEDSPPDPAPAPTSGSTGGAGGSSVDIAAAPDGSFAYEQTSVEAKAGEVTINFDNPASLGHDVVVEGPDGEVGGTDIISGETTTTTLELEPGDYTFFCSVPGHREGGMEGDLTVD